MLTGDGKSRKTAKKMSDNRKQMKQKNGEKPEAD